MARLTNILVAGSGIRLNRASPLARGVALTLPFHGSGSGAYERDISGNGKHLSVNGSPTREASPDFSRAFRVNGVSGQYGSVVSIGDRVPNTGFTTSFWFRIMGDAAGSGGVNCNSLLVSGPHETGSGTYYIQGWGISTSGTLGQLYLGAGDGSTGLYAIFNDVYTRGVWVHVVVAWYAGFPVLYVNGRVASSVSSGGSVANPLNSVGGYGIRIGGDFNGTSYANAQICGVVIHDRILTAAEARALYDPRTRFDLYCGTGGVGLIGTDYVAPAAVPTFRRVLRPAVCEGVAPRGCYPKRSDPTRINWADPITHGLKFATILDGEARAQDLVTGTRPTATDGNGIAGGPQTSIDRYGAHVYHPDEQAHYLHWAVPGCNLTTRGTWLFRFRIPSSTSINADIFAKGRYYTSGKAWAFQYQTDNTFRLTIETNFYDIFTGTPALDTDVLTTVGLTYDKDGGTNNLKSYRDGVYNRGQTTSAITIPTTSDPITLGGDDNGSGAFPIHYYFAYVWDRVLSAAEIARLERNPRCILVPEPRPILVYQRNNLIADRRTYARAIARGARTLSEIV